MTDLQSQVPRPTPCSSMVFFYMLLESAKLHARRYPWYEFDAAFVGGCDEDD